MPSSDLCTIEEFVLGHELAIRLLGNGLVDALGFLEFGPQIKVRLGLVMGNGVGIILFRLMCMETTGWLGYMLIK